MSPVVPGANAAVALRPLPMPASRLAGGFWAPRLAANHAAIPVVHERLVAAGHIRNLRIAAGAETGVVEGAAFRDSDVYKWLEAVAWAGLDAGELPRTVAAAQRPDGYLNSVIQVRGGEPYTQLWMSHEHYCAGHLFQAAVAAARTSGDTTLLDVATRLADHLAATFGPHGRTELDGHPLVEMALVELHRQTCEPRYLDLARHFVDTRGYGRATKPGFDPSPYGDPGHYADAEPVRAAGTLSGHAVRAVYFAAGATDVAIETGDAALLAAVRRQFDNVARRKQHVTGGVGSRWDGEAFGDDDELPPDRAYAESCAAIGMLQWAWRLLLATGEAEYADQIERLLYNAVLPAVSLAGDEFFYVNTLHRRTGARPDVQRAPANGRRPWFNCACCPPNLLRTLASLPAYLATGTGDGLQIHQYAPGSLSSGALAVDVDTAYPWDERVVLTVRAAPPGEVELALRVPAWAEGSTLDGEPVAAGGYARLRQVFRPGDRLVLELPMPPRLIRPDDRVDALRGCVAVARGPLVYAIEQPDQPEGVTLEDIRLDAGAPIRAENRPELLGGVTVLRTGDTTLIPYFAWANRGPHAMRVWIPEASE
ncbi:glycoside hydrolase family 127 protein [Phytohabitans sp. LJ34]|uniref:glycoside hydrolase family 127 protein n=1 Tax=Phytohabitans sp. LJ34 TaxID=3452217 RepID=UPI003F8CA36B